jgi:pantoate--beta-alanine ligase
MRIVTSVASMQRLARRWHNGGGPIALVPTMGYLHPGHIRLVQHARNAVRDRGKVVVSLFVNPTQFGPEEDLENYPRDSPRDRKLCRAAGVDVLFQPSPAQIYPGKDTTAFSTWVVEERLSKRMEGEFRPLHFRGVTTVVTKLFNIVLPDVAVFGAKDYQQVAVVKRLVRDLNFTTKIVVTPTQREPDGLAMSSRNRYLKGHLRTQAAVLSQALKQAKARVRRSKRPLPTPPLKAQLKRLIESQPDAKVDYIEFFHPDTLQPLRKVQRGVHLALAARIGQTRLIDNARL